MKNKLNKWKGQFLVDHKMLDTLDGITLKQGDKFKIRLLSNRSIGDEKQKH